MQIFKDSFEKIMSRHETAGEFKHCSRHTKIIRDIIPEKFQNFKPKYLSK